MLVPREVAHNRGMTHEITHAGDPRHVDHESWLLELGRATYEASRVSGICFDILRVFSRVDSAAMYSDPLGTLLSRLEGLLAKQPTLPGLQDFVASLRASKETRNDLIHALPVKDGLHRRLSKDLHYVRNFYTVEDLEAVTAELRTTHRLGSGVLYHDGGASVKAWYTAQ
jgi:hypothetical protein